MTKSQNSKPYDLEERTVQFAQAVRSFIKQISKDPLAWEDVRQVIQFF